MERSRIEIDRQVRDRRRERTMAFRTAELRRDRRGLALRDMALRPFRRTLRAAWLVMLDQLEMPRLVRERASS